jgi:hypothetical protein
LCAKRKSFEKRQHDIWLQVSLRHWLAVIRPYSGGYVPNDKSSRSISVVPEIFLYVPRSAEVFPFLSGLQY